MKICFDGIGLSHLPGTGLYSYTYELIANLQNIYPQPNYQVITNKGDNIDRLSLFAKNSSIKFIQMNLDRKQNDYSTLKDYLLNNKVNIYHSPNNGFSIPDNSPCKNVMSVHDLMPLSLKEYTDQKYYDKFMSIMPTAVNKADKIIAVSEFIKSELIYYLKVPQKKVKVVYPILSKQFKQINIDKCIYKIKTKYNFEGEFILYAGSIHIRKNLHYLFAAFKEVIKTMTNLKLVIVGSYEGKRAEYYLKLKEYARKLNILDKVHFIGVVNYSDMPYFYNGAKCVVNTSEYEGFPLSSIEAIACNCPVICSKSSSFEEVLGSCALLVDPKDINNMKDIILEIISNNDYRSESLKSFSKQTSKLYDDKSIKEIIRIYENIC